MTKRVAVAGASGYAGGELLRLLSAHPEFTVTTVTGHSSAGKKLGEVQPHLPQMAHLTLQQTTPEALDGHDIVFFALPHGASGALAAQLRDSATVVDCGADHRLESAADWADYYGTAHSGTWTYGVPELPLVDGGKQRDRLVGATRIAAPGCNASTVALALAPGIKHGLVAAADIVSVLAVAPSGAGKALKTNLLAAEIMGSASAYAVGGTHRHIPEIAQALRNAGAKEPVNISFTPVLVPMSRGIHATVTAPLLPGVTPEAVQQAWRECYADEPFVRVLPEGVQPRTADTVGANTCLLGVTVDTRAGRVVVTAALDNLTKGTAGAAIQSANIALGLPETAGLTVNGVAP